MEAHGKERRVDAPFKQDNVDSSGEPRGMMRGLVWNSCISSAVLLGLVAVGVVVLL
jgi:hypothetical protein